MFARWHMERSTDARSDTQVVALIIRWEQVKRMLLEILCELRRRHMREHNESHDYHHKADYREFAPLQPPVRFADIQQPNEATDKRRASGNAQDPSGGYAENRGACAHSSEDTADCADQRPDAPSWGWRIARVGRMRNGREIWR